MRIAFLNDLRMQDGIQVSLILLKFLLRTSIHVLIVYMRLPIVGRSLRGRYVVGVRLLPLILLEIFLSTWLYLVVFEALSACIVNHLTGLGFVYLPYNLIVERVWLGGLALTALSSAHILSVSTRSPRVDSLLLLSSTDCPHVQPMSLLASMIFIERIVPRSSGFWGFNTFFLVTLFPFGLLSLLRPLPVMVVSAP